MYLSGWNEFLITMKFQRGLKCQTKGIIYFNSKVARYGNMSVFCTVMTDVTGKEKVKIMERSYCEGIVEQMARLKGLKNVSLHLS